METDKRTNIIFTIRTTNSLAKKLSCAKVNVTLSHITIIESISRINNVNVRSEDFSVWHLSVSIDRIRKNRKNRKHYHRKRVEHTTTTPTWIRKCVSKTYRKREREREKAKFPSIPFVLPSMHIKTYILFNERVRFTQNVILHCWAAISSSIWNVFCDSFHLTLYVSYVSFSLSLSFSFQNTM